LKYRRIIKSTVFIALCLILLLAHFYWDASSYFDEEKMSKWLVDAGSFAPLIYMVIMALAVIISPIPSLPLDITAGAFFGVLPGTVFSVIGALAGAVVSFMISRTIGREFVERFLGGHVNFCSTCSDKLLTRIVLFSRLLPVVSFDIISYGAGLTKMSLKMFSLATFFGMIPLTFLYNYFGSILFGSILEFGRGLSVILGLVMVILFFVIPPWLERRGKMRGIISEHKGKDRQELFPK
jgi:uncharacterized membrane protein YdjX (TVP38/TMEM64 family)